jgi:hypothetical protein
MAEKEKCYGEPCDIHIRAIEDGYHIRCCFEPEENSSLARRAGWVPCAPYESKEYSAKTKAALVKKIEEILNEKHCSK